MTERTKKAHPFNTVGGIVGAAGGWAFSRYCGLAAWIPIIAAGLLLLLFAKTPVRPKWFAGAIAVTGAHVIWFILTSALGGNWALAAPDIVLLSAGIIWLWLRPGIGGALFLGILQIASLTVNIFALSSTSIGSALHRALTAHCTFRILAIVCLCYGYFRMRRSASISAAAVSDSMA